MQVFKTRWFARFARNEQIADASLLDAITRAERGLVDADLGGGLIKQRVARKGRSGGHRVMIAYRAQSKAFFLHGFSKSVQDNIGEEELTAFKKFGRQLLTADVQTLNGMLEDGSLKEICDDKEE
jgi:hypothetical protein